MKVETNANHTITNTSIYSFKHFHVHYFFLARITFVQVSRQRLIALFDKKYVGDRIPERQKTHLARSSSQDLRQNGF